MKKLLSRLFQKDLVSAYLYRGGGVALTFVLNVVLARVYGKDLSGEYYVLYNFLALISSLAFLGFGYVIVHYVTPCFSQEEDRMKGNLLLSESVAGILLMTVLVGGAVYAFRGFFSDYLFHDEAHRTDILIVIVSMIPYLATMFVSELFKALKKPNESILTLNILGSSVFIALLLIVRNKSIEAVLGLFAFSYALALVIVLLRYRGLFRSSGVSLLSGKQYVRLRKENRELCRTYRNENLTLSVVAVSNVVLGVFDTFVISAQLSAGDVALYSVANKVVSFGSIILTTINSLVGFQIADLSHKNDEKALSAILVKYTRIMFPLGALYYLFAVVFAFCIPFVFGADFRGSVMLCILLALGQLITIITGPCSYFAIMTGSANKYLQITLTAAIVSVVTNLLFVPLWGIYGSVVSNIITLTYKNVHTFLFVKNKVGIRMAAFLR